MDPDEVIIKFAAERLDILFLLEVSEEPVEQEEPRLSTRHRAT